MIQAETRSALLVQNEYGNTQELPVATVLTYLVEDPFAVELKFHCAGEITRWMVSRSLVAEGCKGDTGDIGDVRIWRSVNEEYPNGLFISLSSPAGAAVLVTNIHVVEKFLFDSYALVQDGYEDSGVDAFLAELFQ